MSEDDETSVRSKLGIKPYCRVTMSYDLRKAFVRQANNVPTISSDDGSRKKQKPVRASEAARAGIEFFAITGELPTAGIHVKRDKAREDAKEEIKSDQKSDNVYTRPARPRQPQTKRVNWTEMKTKRESLEAHRADIKTKKELDRLRTIAESSIDLLFMLNLDDSESTYLEVWEIDMLFAIKSKMSDGTATFYKMVRAYADGVINTDEKSEENYKNSIEYFTTQGFVVKL